MCARPEHALMRVLALPPELSEQLIRTLAHRASHPSTHRVVPPPPLRISSETFHLHQKEPHTHWQPFALLRTPSNLPQDSHFLSLELPTLGLFLISGIKQYVILIVCVCVCVTDFTQHNILKVYPN